MRLDVVILKAYEFELNEAKAEAYFYFLMCVAMIKEILKS